MLKNKENLLLTEEETRLLEQITSDMSTGNHLLYPRTDAYKRIRQEYGEAMEAEEMTERQRQMVEYVKQCSDYFYWKHLPDEEKLFVEINN